MFGLDDDDSTIDDEASLIGLTNDSQTLKNSRTLKKTQNKNAHADS
jgi:hypothetical protein